MPELPEVETVVRTLRPHVVGRHIVSLQEVQRPCFVQESLPCTRAEGLFVHRVVRRGKFIVCRLGIGQCGCDSMARDADHVLNQAAALFDGAAEEDLFWVTHLRMTGTLMAHETAACTSAVPSPTSFCAPKPGRYTRAWARLAGEGLEGCVLLFNDVRTFGRMFLGTRTMLESWPAWTRLGPEPLTMGAEAFAQAIRGKRAIKTVIMDQHVLAGIGNIYADESLFAARLNPHLPADSLSLAQKLELHAQMVRLLRKSIAECGSSIRNYQDADGNVGAFQNSFAVYGRAGSPCPVCGTTLQKCLLNGRGTTFCPRCQQKRAPSRGKSRSADKKRADCKSLQGKSSCVAIVEQ